MLSLVKIIDRLQYINKQCEEDHEVKVISDLEQIWSWFLSMLDQAKQIRNFADSFDFKLNYWATLILLRRTRHNYLFKFIIITGIINMKLLQRTIFKFRTITPEDYLFNQREALCAQTYRTTSLKPLPRANQGDIDLID